MYELLKTLHILAAIVWVGGGVTVQFFALRVRKAGDPARIAAFAQDAEWVGTRVFTPASLLVLILGVAMVVKEEFLAFGDTWILLGLGGVLVSALVGSLFLGPESGRLGKLMAAEGPDSPEVQRRMARLFLVSRIELAILLLVVVDMVIRPGQ